MVFTKYLWQVQCVCAKVNEAYNEQDTVTWGLNSFQFVLWLFFFPNSDDCSDQHVIWSKDHWGQACRSKWQNAWKQFRPGDFVCGSSEGITWRTERAERAERAERIQRIERTERTESVRVQLGLSQPWHTKQGVLLSAKHPEIRPETGYPLPLKGGYLLPSLSCCRGIVLGVGLSCAPLRAWPSSTMTSQFDQTKFPCTT